RVVLDLGLVHEVLVADRLACGRIEDLLLDLRVHGELGADLLGELLLLSLAARALEALEERAHPLVVVLEQGDGVHPGGATRRAASRLRARRAPGGALARCHGVSFRDLRVAREGCKSRSTPRRAGRVRRTAVALQGV